MCRPVVAAFFDYNLNPDLPQNKKFLAKSFFAEFQFWQLAAHTVQAVFYGLTSMMHLSFLGSITFSV